MERDTRQTLHVIAAHILGGRRFDVTGRFGLRATPGGFGTPAFGEAPEVVRVAGATLVREFGAATTRMAIPGASLRSLASFAGTTIDADFSVGPDTPPLGDPDAALEVDATKAAVIADWYRLGWEVLDAFLATLPSDAEPTTIQLWPERFDAGTTIAVGGANGGEHLNLGFSPGDGFEPEPYAYVGPWSEHRPGDAAFWNAPFGAVLRAAEVVGSPDPLGRCRDFLAAGLKNATAG